MKKIHFKTACAIACIVAIALSSAACNKKDIDPSLPEDNSETEKDTTMDISNENIMSSGYLTVPNSIARDGKTDVTEALQNFINSNPNRTIFFPDGVYLISEPLKTSSKTDATVSLVLSQYAIIRADAENWYSNQAMIRLGAYGDHGNGEDAYSHTSFTGGVIDGSGIASGISIESGIQTSVSSTTITNTLVGLHIKHGSNNGSADADISNINIYGNGDKNSIGILVNAHDNTFTNIRIGKVKIGVQLNRGANVLRNIHPLLYNVEDSDNSVAFVDNHGTNWYDFCYSDQFRTAFLLADGIKSYFRDCYVFYYADFGDEHTIFSTNGAFNSVVDTLRVCFRDKEDNILLKTGNNNGNGTLSNLCIDHKDKLKDSTYKNYMK